MPQFLPDALDPAIGPGRKNRPAPAAPTAQPEAIQPDGGTEKSLRPAEPLPAKLSTDGPAVTGQPPEHTATAAIPDTATTPSPEPAIKPGSEPAESPDVTARRVGEQIEAGEYELLLPAGFEQIRAFLANDGFLSTEELTRALADADLDRAALRQAVATTVTATLDTGIDRLTEQLWEAHQTLHRPAPALDPDTVYRLTPTGRIEPVSPETGSKQENRTVDESSPSLGLVRGGFAANFLHNLKAGHAAGLALTGPSRTAPGEPRPDVNRPGAARPEPAPAVGAASTSVSTQPIPMEQQQPAAPTRYQWDEIKDTLAQFGLTKDNLTKSGDLNDLLNGRKTGLLQLQQRDAENIVTPISGKLYVVFTAEKGPQVFIQPERMQLKMPDTFLGHELTQKDKQNLEQKGEMGRVVPLRDKVSGEPFQAYVGVDRDTRSLTVLRQDRIRMPVAIKGVTLSPEQRQQLGEGRAIKLTGMTGNDGQPFNAWVQVSAAKRSLAFTRLPDQAVAQTVDRKLAQELPQQTAKATVSVATEQKATKTTVAQKPETAEKVQTETTRKAPAQAAKPTKQAVKPTADTTGEGGPKPAQKPNAVQKPKTPKQKVPKQQSRGMRPS